MAKRFYEIDDDGIAVEVPPPSATEVEQPYADLGTSQVLTNGMSVGFDRRMDVLLLKENDSLNKRVTFLSMNERWAPAIGRVVPFRPVGVVEFGAGASSSLVEVDIGSGVTLEVPGAFIKASAYLETEAVNGVASISVPLYEVTIAAFVSKRSGGPSPKPLTRTREEYVSPVFQGHAIPPFAKKVTILRPAGSDITLQFSLTDPNIATYLMGLTYLAASGQIVTLDIPPGSRFLHFHSGGGLADYAAQFIYELGV